MKGLIFSIVFIFAFAVKTVGQTAIQTGWKNCTLEVASTAMDNVNNWFVTNKIFKMRIRHNVFEGFNSSKIADANEGYLIKYKENYHSCLLGIHTIQNEKIKITIDSSEQMILVSNPEKMEYDLLQLKVSKEIFKGCVNFKCRVEGSNKYFRLEFPSTAMYEYMDFGVGKDSRLILLVYYIREKFPLTASNDEENDEDIIKVQPRLELIFDQFDFNIDPGSKEFDETTYVSKQDQKYRLKERYKNYNLKDVRTKP